MGTILILVFYCFTINYHKLSSLKQHMSAIHRVRGPGPQAQLSWVFAKVAVKVLARAALSSGGCSADGTTSRPCRFGQNSIPYGCRINVFLAVGWGPCSVPRSLPQLLAMRPLFVGPLRTRRLASSKSAREEVRQPNLVFVKTIMGVTSRPVYQCWLDTGTLVILLVRNKSQVPWRGGDHMKAGAGGQRDHGDA